MLKNIDFFNLFKKNYDFMYKKPNIYTAFTVKSPFFGRKEFSIKEM